jgi:hypothetical protein
MINKKCVIMPKQYSCIRCSFKCSKESNYKNHIMTAKHKMITNDNKMPKNATAFTCECGKLYKFASGLSRHKVKCDLINKNNETGVVDVPSNSVINNENNSILELILQNKELMNLLITKNHQTDELILQNKEMQKTVLEIVPKIGNNNNNTTNNNNQFNLQVFLTEDCKDALNFTDFVKQIQISFADLENQAENGYVKGISQLFVESLNELGKHKRPIHCTDKKRKTLYIKEKDEWDKEGSLDTLKKGIQEVSRRTFEELIKSKEENAEAYNDADSEFSEKCISIQRNLVPNYPRETTINKVIEIISKTSTIEEK